MKPYIVSCDLARLWNNAGVAIADEQLQDFRNEVTLALQECVGPSEWIGERELADGMAEFVTNCPVTVVSLDPVYAPQPLSLSLTRLISHEGREAGYGARTGEAQGLVEAVNALCDRLSVKEIALVDDVLFSGAMIHHLIELFKHRGVHVRHVIAGIAIGEGIDRLRAAGCTVEAVRSYDEVVDEICERDFMPGAPMSGRTVAGIPNTGAPYILPFGDPVRWASVPEGAAHHFSRAALLASARFYGHINLRTRELPRNIFGLTAHEELACDALTAVANKLR